jgi:ParB/RepB/Spo0J family partition protein
MNAPRQLALEEIDRRFAALRLACPHELRRLQVSVHSEGRIRDPVLVSTGVQERHWVLVDGFKRLRVAQELGLTHVWAQLTPLDAAQAKVAILQCNQARQGLSEIEEAWIVRSLCREQGLKQTQVAQLLKRDNSWICRRMKLAEALEMSLQDEVRLGLLSATTARELAQLPRGKQLSAAQAVRDHQLSSRHSVLLVKRLRQSADPQAVRELLQDPLRYLCTHPGVGRTRDNDPRLSEEGNRLRGVLLSWQDACSHLTRELRRHQSAAEAHVLAPVLQQALRTGARVLQQLEGIHRVGSEPLPPQPSSPHAPAQQAAVHA